NFFNLLMESSRDLKDNQLAIICLPAIGLGVWKGKPNIYWAALDQAINNLPIQISSRIIIIINPSKIDNMKNIEWNKLIKKKQIILTLNKDLVSIAIELKKDLDHKICLVNASD